MTAGSVWKAFQNRILVSAPGGREFPRKSGIPHLIDWFLWVEPEEYVGISRIQSERPTQRRDPKTFMRRLLKK